MKFFIDSANLNEIKEANDFVGSSTALPPILRS